MLLNIQRKLAFNRTYNPTARTVAHIFVPHYRTDSATYSYTSKTNALSITVTSFCGTALRTSTLYIYPGSPCTFRQLRLDNTHLTAKYRLFQKRCLPICKSPIVLIARFFTEFFNCSTEINVAVFLLTGKINQRLNGIGNMRFDVLISRVLDTWYNIVINQS